MQCGESVQFCEVCPRKNSCVGPIKQATQHNVDASFFSLSDSETGVDISLATRFYDEDGNEADYFPPHTGLDDVGNCTGREVDYRTGFLNLKTVKDCGAYVTAVHRFRESLRH